MTISLTLKGHVPSKKNAWKRGRSRMYLDGIVSAQINSLIRQASSLWRQDPAIHPDMWVKFYVRDKRPDRDNKLTCLLDCLASAGVIENDNIKRFNGTVTLLPAVVDEDERVEIQMLVRRENDVA